MLLSVNAMKTANQNVPLSKNTINEKIHYRHLFKPLLK